MKTAIILAIFMLAFTGVYGQTSQTKGTSTKTFLPDTSEACNPDLIFVIMEGMPNYEGGLAKLEQDLNDSLIFDKDIRGGIFISLFINCNGKAYGFQVLKGIDDKTDLILIHELEKLQNWNAGVQRGQKVDSKTNVGFRINNGRVEVVKR